TGSLGTGPIVDNANLTFDRADSVTVTTAIPGTGSLTQGGTGGTLILTADNSYAGGTTIIPASTLQVGNGGTAGTLGSGPVTDNGLLVINRSDTFILPNDISGTGILTGNLTQAGIGTTILTGSNSYAATTISAGTLQVGNGGTTGT